MYAQKVIAIQLNKKPKVFACVAVAAEYFGLSEKNVRKLIEKGRAVNGVYFDWLYEGYE